MFNPVTYIDGYKLDHRRQYPDKTEFVYSNFTPRASRIPSISEVVFFGLQYFLERYLYEELEFKGFFNLDKNKVLRSYVSRVNNYLGPNSIGTDHIAAWHELGYTPLKFRAVPEGVSVPIKIPMLTVENTHPDFAWLVNYYETLLSSVLWMPCTSATNAREFKKLLHTHADKSGGNKDFIQWQGHDFSFRGMPGPEAAAISGAAHLLFFEGTDCIPALDLIDHYYLTPNPVGGSVTATEHSVMCAGGMETEMQTFERLLSLYPSGILSVVSDTWDLWNVLTNILPKLKDKIMAREGKLVIRPDSGDPVKIICGDPFAEVGTYEHKGVIELLWEVFGGVLNHKGLRTLDSHIGAIYGDSINIDRAEAILKGLLVKGFASDNIVFGIGSYTYQYVTRDTFGFAMKATWVQIDGKEYSIFKNPITDDGIKRSSTGRLSVIRNDDGNLILIPNATPSQESMSVLRPVWQDGEFVNPMLSFNDVRINANNKRQHGR